MWPFWGEQIDPGKLTKALSDGQVYKDKKTDCQTDIKGKDDGNGKKKEKGERQKTGGDGETPVGWIPFGINSYTVFAS